MSAVNEVTDITLKGDVASAPGIAVLKVASEVSRPELEPLEPPPPPPPEVERGRSPFQGRGSILAASSAVSFAHHFSSGYRPTAVRAPTATRSARRTSSRSRT